MIAVVIWNLQSIIKAIEAGKNRDRAQNALFAALNCAELIRQLLTFARNQPRQAKLMDLAEHVPRVGKLLTPLIGEGIKLNIKLPHGLWPVYADPAQVESALLNLAINGRDAMPKGGMLTIEATEIEMDGRDPELPFGRYAVVAVSDTGIGMPPDVVARAFEPFFTTKEQGSGTGLGLSMVYGFVKQSGGDVRIESRPGVGTTVRVYLPSKQPTPAVVGPTESARQLSFAGRVVLAVEDDPGVRAITRARLEELGCEVIEADRAAAALELLEAGTAVDVILTDMVMPGGLSGLDLARRVRELKPDAKVIFTSGYAASFQSASENLGPFLQKPYSDEDLVAALDAALPSADDDATPLTAA
jgi:two-component system, cell cycle sensor histidine kinase and response regulator CckA